MIVIQQFLLLLFTSLSETNVIQNFSTRPTTSIWNSNTNSSIGKVKNEKKTLIFIIII